MKRLLFLLLLFPVLCFAGAKEDLDGLKDIGRHMGKCGYQARNPRSFIRKIIRENDTAKSGCLKSKDAEVEVEALAEKNKRDALKNALEWHRANVKCFKIMEGDQTNAAKKARAECRIFQE